MIDARRALELLCDVVEVGGEDFVCPKVPLPEHHGGTGCRYEYEGQPSCIVGQALSRAGVGLDVLVLLDESGTRARDLWAKMPQVSDGAARVFQSAQAVQDAGARWGMALGYARETYEWYVEAQDAA